MKYFINVFLMLLSIAAYTQPLYTMPDEADLHEGTWLAWPHDYTYGAGNRSSSEQVWIDMTKELTQGEMVHMIAYNANERNHIEQVLQAENVDMNMVDFYLIETDDYWMRDNGPIFAYDANNNLVMTDWDFNGWGNSAPYAKDNLVPVAIENITGMTRIDVSDMVLEGGSIEIDGHGSALLCRSSVTNTNRNPNLSEQQVEDYLTTNLGITNFIWLDGTPGLDITDFHIDGFARFLNEDTILTLDSLDLLDWGTSATDIQTLYSAQKPGGGNYDYVFLPQTQNNVSNYWGQNLGYKGSYVNFYIGNACVLVPTYNDPNDQVALNIIQGLYPNRNVVGIDVTRIYEWGGMIHCITQQQPVDLNANGIEEASQVTSTMFPNPVATVATVEFDRVLKGQAVVTDMAGKVVGQYVLNGNRLSIDVAAWPSGAYVFQAIDSKGIAVAQHEFIVQ